MALTESNMLPLGTIAPNFNLIDTVSGEYYGLTDVIGEKATVVIFLCNHCPYVIHVNDGIVQLSKDYVSKGVSFVAISSNDVVRYPQDGPDKMKEHARAAGYDFPYLYDETQEVARKYDAACTPDFYVFNGNTELVYRGQMDSARPGNANPITGQDLRNALDAVLDGRAVDSVQRPSAGCNIKWK